MTGKGNKHEFNTSSFPGGINRAAPAGDCARRRMAGATDPHDHPVRARRRRRHRRADVRRGAGQGARPAGDGRQQGRRRRPSRHRRGRARAGRRLHAAADLAGHDGVEPRALQGAGLRSAEGSRAGHHHRRAAQRAGRGAHQSRQQRRRPGRPGEGQAGRAHLRLERRRLEPAPVGRDPRAAHRRAPAARALPRRAGRRPRRDQRRGGDGLLQCADGDPARSRRAS